MSSLKHEQYQLLIRPTPYSTEGPRGYLHRLAQENYISLNELLSVGINYEYETLVFQGLLTEKVVNPDLHAQVQWQAELYSEHNRIWNHRQARYCPHCLSEGQHWRAEWELYFYDVCHIHNCWLIDICTSCNQKITWNRAELLRCDCGSDLCTETTREAPKSICGLSEQLSSKLTENKLINNHPVLDALNIDQTQRLIRYLGNYMSPIYEKKPLKMRGASSLEKSWQVTSVAAEILADWPSAFYQSLDRIQKESSSVRNPSLSNAFGQAYHYIYKGLKEKNFKPLRDTFEHWISQNWKGGVAKRNKRLAQLLLSKAQWIPGNLACEKLGISAQRLERLIHEGVIFGEIYFTEKGRKYMIVRQDNFAVVKANLDGLIDMTQAGELLGLNKRRMRQILRQLFPEARKSGNSPSSPWCISRHQINELLDLNQHLNVLAIPDENSVSLAHVLRYWANSSEEIVAVINAVKEKELVVVASLDSHQGIARWIFEEKSLRAWLQRFREGHSTWMTISQASKLIGIKEQVAYDMVKFGFLETEVMPKQAKKGTRVKSAFVKAFNEKYIFGTEAADKLGVSPRKAIAILSKEGIEPISGPKQDGGRQLLYLRNNAIRSLL